MQEVSSTTQTSNEPVFRVTIPMRLPSRANLEGGHWERQGIAKRQRRAAGGTLDHFTAPSLPVTVRLTRIAPRRLDSLDNIAMALKAVKDAVASWLGVDDADERITWLPCRQTKDPQRRPRYQAARIEVWGGQARCGACGADVVPGASLRNVGERDA